MMKPADDAENARRQIEALRRKLLDLTMRNRMLNYRPSTRLGVEVVGNDSVHLHRLLVEEGRKLAFVGKPEANARPRPDADLFAADDDVSLEIARQAAVEELDAFLGPAPARPAPEAKLRSEEPDSVLQAKLRTILREAKSASDELGVNTLFMTLGMLEWSDGGPKSAFAPLVFIPVTLEKQAHGSVRLVYEGSDPGANLPLRAKLLELNVRLPDWDDERTLSDYFDEVVRAVRAHPDWSVHRDEVKVGFFNYEKYAMYVDLGGDNWPPERKPWDNPDLLAIFSKGYPPAESAVGDQTFLDAVRPVAASREVFDADSSQTVAIVRAMEGLSMVVEGPPGTGKSQTITNIIAEAVAAGKSVLFVSAKRAALDVVRRNLDRAGLGAICLDLHDKLTNRREFYAEIKRTVDGGLTVRDDEARVQRLTELRDRLNSHCTAVNEPLEGFGCAPFEAMARLAALPAERPEHRIGRIDFECLRSRRLAEVEADLPFVEALKTGLEQIGVPVEHPYWGCAMDYLDPGRRLDLEVGLEAAANAAGEARLEWAELAARFDLGLSASTPETRTLRQCLELARDAPPHAGVRLDFGAWKAAEPAIRRAIENLEIRRDVRSARASDVRPEAWSANLTAIEQIYAQYGPRWFRFLIGAFRRAEVELGALLSPSGPRGVAGRSALVRDVLRAQAAERSLAEGASQMRTLFAEGWLGLDTDPQILARLLGWGLDVQKAILEKALPPGVIGLLDGPAPDDEAFRRLASLERAGEKLDGAYSEVTRMLEYRDGQSEEDWTTIGSRVGRWRTELARLPGFITYSAARRRVVERGLDPVAQIADRWPEADESLVESFLRSYFSGVVRQAIQERPELKAFDRSAHEAAIGEFRSLDDFKLLYNRAQLRLSHNRRLPTFEKDTAGNLLDLKIQCELMRRHKPIRWIMSRAGEAIQRIKPVFMMSPLTVAIHLPPDMPRFDLVVFDEASQIKPEDALCAIARANQCIVVGDTRQMPPTSFFERVINDEADEEDAGEPAIGQEAQHLESVLSLLSAVVVGRVRRPDLRWHYRSVDPSLIEPSNRMFYDGRLIVFPSPYRTVAARTIGLTLRYHPETVYEAGSRARTNFREAEMVADRVVEMIAEKPEESLFVAAMNKPQAELINDQVALRERARPEPFARYRELHPHEPLEVKNLETIQGDERDVVLISVTYGRDAAGVIRQHYGPLLLDGGERRLNVLFTRARRRCEIFSNLRADDVRIDRPSPGVVALKRYLLFAEQGILDAAVPSGGAEESPFEEEVAKALRDRGYQVDCQIGCEGYRLDLGVVDREEPGRYVLGIECDGASYHSARSARDRDKLRQRVLEARGWRIHRIWSHDWWQNQAGEVARMVEAIERDVARPIPAAVAVEAPVVLDSDPRTPAPPPIRPYVAAVAPESIADEAALERFLAEVVRIEGPIHRNLLLIRLRDAAGYETARGRTRAWLESMIERQAGRMKQFEDAMYAADPQLYLARDWSARPAGEKKMELVTEPEIAAALKAVVRRSFGVGTDEAVKAAIRLLGFRASAPSVARVASVLEKLTQSGGVRLVEGILQVASK